MLECDYTIQIVRVHYVEHIVQNVVNSNLSVNVPECWSIGRGSRRTEREYSV